VLSVEMLNSDVIVFEMGSRTRRFISPQSQGGGPLNYRWTGSAPDALGQGDWGG
jgi:hypothetical protein